jgi:hypothetical protein
MPKYEPHIAEAHATPRQRAAVELNTFAKKLLDTYGAPVPGCWTSHIAWRDGELLLVMRVSVDLKPTAEADRWRWDLPNNTLRVRTVIEVVVGQRTVLQTETTRKGDVMIGVFRPGKTWEQRLRALVERHQIGQGAADTTDDPNTTDATDTSSPADPDDDWVDPEDERERLAAVAAAATAVATAAANTPTPTATVGS